MTFLEAAIEILRNAQGPLHFSEIARQAVDRGLLSHVGRDPEATMRSSLNAAVRGNNDPILVRTKPGHYAIRPGAELPDPPEPKPAKKTRRKKSDDDEVSAKPKSRRKTTRSRRRKEPEPEVEEVEEVEEEAEAEEIEVEEAEAEEAEVEEAEEDEAEVDEEEADADEEEADADEEEADADEEEADADEEEEDDADEEEAESDESEDAEEEAESDESEDAEEEAESESSSKRSRSKRKRRRRSSGNRYGVRGEAPPPQVVAVKPSRRGADPSKRNEVIQKVQNLEFEAPQGSGLEGVTDVAVVMANAMSRLVEERPELRGELELIQQRAQAERQAQSQSAPSKSSRRAREREREEEERGGRRRRRRRRRSKRIEWSQAGGDSRHRSDDPTAALLLQAAKVLEGAGARSLHIRQLAEQLAQQNVLGGEISEIERAVSAAILTDVHRNGRSSRFVARGDARYQLQGTRLPGPAAIAEDALRVAAQAVAAETDRQLLHWVHSLGQRGLEALVRIYLAEEEYDLKASLPPGKGVGKLVAIDPDPDDDDPRVLVVIAPRKAAIDPSVWGADLERNNISSALVFTMADEVGDWDDARVIQGPELARWLRENGVGVGKAKIEVPVLDPTLIESISGLDT